MAPVEEVLWSHKKENHLDCDTKHALKAPVDLSFNIVLVASYTYINNKVLYATCSIFRTSYYNLIQTSAKYYQLRVSNKQATEYSFIMSPGGKKGFKESDSVALSLNFGLLFHCSFSLTLRVMLVIQTRACEKSLK